MNVKSDLFRLNPIAAAVAAERVKLEAKENRRLLAEKLAEAVLISALAEAAGEDIGQLTEAEDDAV